MLRKTHTTRSEFPCYSCINNPVPLITYIRGKEEMDGWCH